MRMDFRNPATGEVITSMPKAGAKEAREAVDAAHEAFGGWKRRGAFERSKLLMKWYELIMKHKQALAETMTQEQGKPLKESLGEIEYAASYVEWYAEEAKRVSGAILPSSNPDKRLFTLKQPIGVVAVITPWNFPAAMIARKVAPALAAGCTCVAKPAEQTPLTALALAKLAEEAGLPPGVLRVVVGDPEETADAWFKDERVRKVSFTGSTAVGKHIMRRAADTMKRVSLELGGHAPLIVCRDADLDLAVRETVRNKFRNAGQTCICTNRVYVHEEVLYDFLGKLKPIVEELKVGYGLEDDTDIGPIIDGNGLRKIERHVRDAVERGANVVCGGESASIPGYVGAFYQPTILSGVTRDMEIMKEETFGPVLPIASFRDYDEAVRSANDTRYGLAAYIFTRDIALGTKLSEELDYGIIGLNDGAPSAAELPFGGMKESGMGREGAKEGIESYLETKAVSMGL